MSLNFLVRGRADNPSQTQMSQPQGNGPLDEQRVPSSAGPVPGSSRLQRERLPSTLAPTGEASMSDDLHAIAALIGQLSDDSPDHEDAPSMDDADDDDDAHDLPEATKPHEGSLFDECQATLARLDAAKSSGESLLSQIEVFSETLERQATELALTRSSMAKLASDNSRLVNENDRLRVMLRSLLDAVDADARRSNESIAVAERRLRDLHRQPGERQPMDRAKQQPARGLVAEG
jgi:regulator of replication initiation timing